MIVKIVTIILRVLQDWCGTYTYCSIGALFIIFFDTAALIFLVYLKKMVMILSPSSKHFQVFHVEIHVWQVKMSLFIFCKVYSTLTDCPQTQRILSQHCKDVNTIALFCPSVQYLFFSTWSFLVISWRKRKGASNYLWRKRTVSIIRLFFKLCLWIYILA